MGPILFHSAHCLIASTITIQPSVNRDLLVAWAWQPARDCKREEREDTEKEEAEQATRKEERRVQMYSPGPIKPPALTNLLTLKGFNIYMNWTLWRLQGFKTYSAVNFKLLFKVVKSRAKTIKKTTTTDCLLLLQTVFSRRYTKVWPPLRKLCILLIFKREKM